MGGGGNAAGSGATPGRCRSLHLRTSVHRGQADPSAGPPAARAPEAARQHYTFSMEEIVTESNEPSWGTVPAVSREAVSVHMEVLCPLSRR